MSLDQKIAAFLAQADTRPAPSKLEPYAELITQLRQRRWTYQRIATALREMFDLSVAPSTIHNFQKVRQRRASSLPERPPSMISAQVGSVKRPRFNLDA
ncbi:MAG: helix-turn-helix domain-containing protein [Opitutae bacterium]|nr:helix-turn-helix domain-containing protein [Opitutae bacterium]